MTKDPVSQVNPSLSAQVFHALGGQTPDLRTLLHVIYTLEPEAIVYNQIVTAGENSGYLETTVFRPSDGHFRRQFPLDLSLPLPDVFALTDHIIHYNLCMMFGLPVTITAPAEQQVEPVPMQQSPVLPGEPEQPKTIPAWPKNEARKPNKFRIDKSWVEAFDS